MRNRFVALTFIGLTALTSAFFSKQAIAQEVEQKDSNSLNYIGIGAGNSGLAVYSKFTLGDNFSLRPMIVGEFDFDDFDDFEGKVIVPLTYDFNTSYKGAMPFAGVGGGTSTENFDFGWVLTAGVDYPISKRFTATGLVNVELFEDNDINAIVGLGFNF